MAPQDAVPVDQPRESQPPLDVGTMTAAMSQHVSAAMGLRRERQLTRAIKQMERAIDICAGREAEHPALAVEGARVRISLGALLSEGGRHTEALSAIKEAQAALDSVRSWVRDCGDGDAGVVAIGQEAEALHCAAMMAEAVEVESYGDGHGPKDMHKQLISEANSFAADRLPQSHPVASLAKKFDKACVVCAQPGADTVDRTPKANVADGSVKLPVVNDMRSPSGRSSPALVAPSGSETEPVEAVRQQAMTLDIMQGSMEPMRSRSGSKCSERPQRSLRYSAKSKKDAMGRSTDIFTEFIHSAKVEKDARLAAKGGGQDDITKRLHQKHRLTKMLIEQSEDDDLKEKRYTKTGHQVFMGAMMKENRSRSDPSLLREGRKMGAAPEVVQVKKLNGLLYVKPSTPEPVVVKKAPEVHNDLASNIGSLFKKPDPAKQPESFRDSMRSSILGIQ